MSSAARQYGAMRLRRESVLMAFSAPVLGSVADAQGPRKPWILAFSLPYIVGAAGLWLAVPGMADPLPVLVFLVLALIGAELTLVFVNSLLPEVGPHEELGRISGSGWAFGLLGRLGGARHRARPDDAGAGLRKDDTRHRADPGTRCGRRARARARPGRSRCSGMSSSWCPSSSGRRMCPAVRAPPVSWPRACGA